MATKQFKALDLFSGAGGCSVGYHRAGFEMTGVDHRPMPRYPYEFIQADALEYVAEHGHEYDFIHCSPPCQGYSRMRHLPWLKDRVYPMLIDATRAALEATGKPWVIENVEDAPLRSGITLCGASFGLKVYRHRRFESNILLLAPPHRPHQHTIGHGHLINTRMSGSGVGENGFVTVAGHRYPFAAGCAAMGIDWMTKAELNQSIPPPFTEYVGRQLIAAMQTAVTA